MRYGIFGGSFDPIHFGHLLLAERCREHAKLDHVFFVPTGVSPHRRGKSAHAASAADRVAMLERAIDGYGDFSISRFDIEQAGPSYTVATLRHFHATLMPEARPRNNDSHVLPALPPPPTLSPIPELFLILGADMAHDLPFWREPAEILRMASLLTAARPGVGPPSFEALAPFCTAEKREQCRLGVVAMPQIDISSTQIRRHVRKGESIRFQTPRNVEEYIRNHRLYTGP